MDVRENIIIIKKPGEKICLSVDYFRSLQDAEMVSSATIVVINKTTGGDETGTILDGGFFVIDGKKTNSKVVQRYQAGSAGTSYKVTVKGITDLNSQTCGVTFTIKVVDQNIQKTITKQTFDKKLFGLDFALWMNKTEQITSAVVTSEEISTGDDKSASMTSIAPQIVTGDKSASKILQVIEAGTDNEDYLITFQATTDEGSVLEGDLLLKVKDG